MYGIYANIWDILMVNVTIYIAYMDPMGIIGKRLEIFKTAGHLNLDAWLLAAALT